MGILGIMTHRIQQPGRFQKYRKTALIEGFSDVVIFTPSDVDLERRHIRGYRYFKGGWSLVESPFPLIAYDIGYYSKPSTIRKVKSIKSPSAIPFAGYSLGDKWTIQKRLMDSSLLSGYLPPTQPFAGARSLLDMMIEHGAVMIKPLNGKGGKGIIKLSASRDGYLLSRTGSPRGSATSYTSKQIMNVLKVLRAKGNYIVQKWIDIRDRGGHVFDIRALMQKNQFGKWQLSGMAVRQAKQATITSNLKSGGTAYEVLPFLQRQFGRVQAEAIHLELNQLADQIPAYLEASYKKRFVELGIDLAVDRDGTTWILEVNIKPGRRIMSNLYGKKAALDSFRAPIKYSWFLVENKLTSPSHYRNEAAEKVDVKAVGQSAVLAEGQSAVLAEGQAEGQIKVVSVEQVVEEIGEEKPPE